MSWILSLRTDECETLMRRKKGLVGVKVWR